ncbi:hypothetical protein JW711_02425 [Candidatus Woesearchaeota archaeon]|nr:hypothetical protein [Candidatus Woesearchaeota archaeon]
MNRSSGVVAALLLLMLIIPYVSADMISPGAKGLSYCFRIGNIADYPEYSFLMAFNYASKSGGYVTPTLINPGDCIDFYKASNPTIYAVHKENLNETILTDDFFDYSRRRNYAQQLYNKHMLIPSSVLLSFKSYTDVNDPLDGIEETFLIQGVDDDALDLKKESVIYLYNDDTSETALPRPEGGFEEPRHALIPLWLYVLIFSLIPTIIIEFLVILAFIRKEPGKLLLFSTVMNMITWPIAYLTYNFMRNQLILHPYPILLAVEMAVFAAETVAIRFGLKQGWPKSTMISIVANGITAFIGLFLIPTGYVLSSMLF